VPTHEEARLLARFARACIAARLGGAAADRPSGGVYDEPGASFVSLHWPDGRLQGCIGSLEPVRPLADDVARSAVGAAFRDPRAAPLTTGDARVLAVEVSILSALEPLDEHDEARLCAALRPGVDGVVFTWRHHHATFLPQMGPRFADAAALLAEPMLKAGLPADFWAPDVEVSRYAVSFGEAPSGEA
jgi:AmmeMemoRadiSam system protein A